MEVKGGEKMREVEYSNSKALFHKERIQLLKLDKPIIPTEIQVDPEAFLQ